MLQEVSLIKVNSNVGSECIKENVRMISDQDAIRKRWEEYVGELCDDDTG